MPKHSFSAYPIFFTSQFIYVSDSIERENYHSELLAVEEQSVSLDFCTLKFMLKFFDNSVAKQKNRQYIQVLVHK